MSYKTDSHAEYITLTRVVAPTKNYTWNPLGFIASVGVVGDRKAMRGTKTWCVLPVNKGLRFDFLSKETYMPEHSCWMPQVRTLQYLGGALQFPGATASIATPIVPSVHEPGG